MKRLFYLFSTFVIFFIISLIILNKTTQGSPLPVTNLNTPQLVSPSVQPVIEEKTQVGDPVKLRIPAIGVDSFVERVGLDYENKMDVPVDADNVGWYYLGYKAGEKGSAVMAGHLDKISGEPAVFWNLGNLQSGDVIEVEDDKGNVFKYKVTDVKVYEFDKVPLEEIFASSHKPMLNLITCNGEYDEFSRNYSNRTVVYSELVN